MNNNFSSKKNIIVVGSGWAGTVIARQLAEQNNRTIKLIEKRNHIAGNMYDEIDKYGILVQRYGPHYFCTNNFNIVKYVKNFCNLYEHVFKVTSFVDGKHICCPYNFTTVKQLVGEEKAALLYNKFRYNFKGQDTVSMYDLIQCSDNDIVEYANLLYEKVYKNYIAKMWGLSPEKIDRSVVDRTQVFMNYSERKGGLDFYYLPADGYTTMFNKILTHKNIQITMNTDALKYITFNNDNNSVLYDNQQIDCLVFTGPIDELFNYKYGVLPYRALDIRFTHHKKESVLPTEVVYYPQNERYIRQTEYRKMMTNQSKCKGTVISTEISMEYNKNAEIGNEPYYPVLTSESKEMYEKYCIEAEKYKNLFLCGRLANFRYYDMDTCIAKALETSDIINIYLDNINL